MDDDEEISVPVSFEKPPTELLRDRVVLVLGAIGCLLWFAALFLKWASIFTISYEELALLGVVVAAMLQLEYIPAIVGDFRREK